MVGLEWDGPGVLLLASDKLSQARLDFAAGQYDFRDMADLLANFRPPLSLALTIDTAGPGCDRQAYVLIAAEDWAEAIRALFEQWTPGQTELAQLAPAGRREIEQ